MLVFCIELDLGADTTSLAREDSSGIFLDFIGASALEYAMLEILQVDTRMT